MTSVSHVVEDSFVQLSVFLDFLLVDGELFGL